MAILWPFGRRMKVIFISAPQKGKHARNTCAVIVISCIKKIYCQNTKQAQKSSEELGVTDTTVRRITPRETRSILVAMRLVFLFVDVLDIFRSISHVFGNNEYGTVSYQVVLLLSDEVVLAKTGTRGFLKAFFKHLNFGVELL